MHSSVFKLNQLRVLKTQRYLGSMLFLLAFSNLQKGTECALHPPGVQAAGWGSPGARCTVDSVRVEQRKRCGVLFWPVVENPPLATKNLLEDTDGLRRPPFYNPSVPSRCGSPLLSADVRSSDDIIAF